ncbi:MAG: DUF4178 domain-containing protein [Pseudomonadota bacterium]
MTLHLPCPNCGAPVAFRSAALPSVVCAQCRSMLVRSDSGVAVTGVSAAVPFDVSPVQLGMRGSIDGLAFEVVGRLRWAWTDGSWNEWLLLFGDGRTRWLGDAMGQFMILEERPFEAIKTRGLKTIAAGGEAVPGTELQIDGGRWVIGDARDVVCIAAEGELPLDPRPGSRLYSVDIRNATGDVASLQRDAEGTSFYSGRYVTLAELAPRGLRAFEGWALPTYA